MAPPLKLGNFGGNASPGSERPIFGPRGWHNRLTDRHNPPRLESRCRVVRKSLRGHFERASRYSQQTQEQTIAKLRPKLKTTVFLRCLIGATVRPPRATRNCWPKSKR